MNDKAGNLTFPCVFALKVMGKNTDKLRPAVLAIVRKHVPDLDESLITSRPSSGGAYLALTVTFTATGRDQLDAIYRELNAHELVAMTL